MCVSVSDSALKQWSPPAWLLSAASYADNSFYWPLLIINESSKNSICFIAGQQVFKGRRQQLNCAAAIILLRMQFYIFPRRCLQLNWGNGTLFIFTASPLRSRLASLLPVSQVVLQTSHRLHNRFSQSRRRLKVPTSAFTFKTLLRLVPQIDPSVPQPVFTITEKAPILALSHLRHY